MLNIKPIFLLGAFILHCTISFAQYLPSEGSQKFGQLLNYINNTYVDSVNEERLVEKAIVAMMKDLDPHSVYIPKKKLKKMNEPLVGNFEGIGIQYNIFKDTLLVVSPISGGPSEKVGIQSGDKIIKVDGEVIAGTHIQNSDVQRLLRGKKGTIVTLDVKRRGERGLLRFTIIRDKIPIYSMDAAYMVTKDIGYIKINRFARNTLNEFRKGLYELKQKNMQHLVLDLRGNGGGYLSTAIGLADEFLGGDKLLVYTKGRNNPRQPYYTRARGNFEYGKLIVLTDEGSASASEIVSGAIQDYDRGLIIGRRTFGKGLVQKPYQLLDSSGIRLTIARYYTPSGRCIQRPYGEGNKEYYKELARRYDSGELMNQDSIDFPDSLKFQTAYNQRIVYGGGGIMPDIFVPIDTSGASDYFGKINRKGLLNQFALSYMDGNRSNLEQNYPTVELYKRKFDAEKEVLKKFINYADDEGVEKKEEQIAISKELICIRLKSLIARNLFGTSAYFEVSGTKDVTLQRAVRAINDDSFDRLKLVYK